jgi:hypothetical protein
MFITYLNSTITHPQKRKSTIDCLMRTRARAQLIVFYSRFIEMYPWAYGTIYGCQPEMDLYLSLLPAVLVVILVQLYTLSLWVCMRVHCPLNTSSRACLGACMRACLREPGLRESRFGTSRVFHGKVLADGKLWVYGSFCYIGKSGNRLYVARRAHGHTHRS